jgi:hypothetical protein
MLKDDPIHPKIEKIIDESSYNSRCGGHIHMVRAPWGEGLTARNTWDLLVERWSWLFALLYPNRGRNQYCRMQHLSRSSSGDKLSDDGGWFDRTSKYNWLNIKSPDRMEVRIFPEVKTVQRLRNRMRLLELVMSEFHNAKNPEEAFTLTMDKIVPQMRQHGSLNKFPRRSQWTLANANLGLSIYWPSNFQPYQRPRREPAFKLRLPKMEEITPEDEGQFRFDLLTDEDEDMKII